MNLYEKSASELSKLIASRECSSVEVTTSFLNHAKQLEENSSAKLNAFITLDEEGALAQAKEVDEKLSKGEVLSPLAGIPVGVKDNINVKGLSTTCASKMLANFQSPYDASVIKNMKHGGMVLLGKLNMDEFAIGTSGETSYFGRTQNPWNANYTPGGSSSGSAASVASHAVPLSLGTDTGGSIRLPSSFCGTVGLKPTYGAVSRYGAIAAASSFDQIGPLGTTVTDVALLYDMIKGHDPKDAVTTHKELPSVMEGLENGVKGLRIGVPKEIYEIDASEEVLNATKEALHALEQQGATIIDVTIPSFEQALATYYIISSAEISSNLGRFDGVRYGFRAADYTDWNDMFIKTRSQGFGQEVQYRIMFGTYVLCAEQYDIFYHRAKNVQAKLIKEFAEIFEKCDVIATPTARKTAFSVGEGAEDSPSTYGMDLTTSIVNLTSLPALSIPCGVGENSLPIGLQLIGKRFDESTLLRTAYTYENVVGGFPKATILRGEN